MAGYNNRNGGAGPAGYATKADVILQREAEISGKIDMLLAAEKGNAGADALSDKIATEAAYISKQNSAIFEKLVQENEKLRREMSYIAAQCENIFTRLSGMISALEAKVDAAAVDYDKVADAVSERFYASSDEEEVTFDDEVAPAAYTEETGD